MIKTIRMIVPIDVSQAWKGLDAPHGGAIVSCTALVPFHLFRRPSSHPHFGSRLHFPPPPWGGDFLRVECTACGHDELIPKVGFSSGWRLFMPLLALQARFRCRECDIRPSVVLSIRWAAGRARS